MNDEVKEPATLNQEDAHIEAMKRWGPHGFARTTEKGGKLVYQVGVKQYTGFVAFRHTMGESSVSFDGAFMTADVTEQLATANLTNDK